MNYKKTMFLTNVENRDVNYFIGRLLAKEKLQVGDNILCGKLCVEYEGFIGEKKSFNIYRLVGEVIL